MSDHSPPVTVPVAGPEDLGPAALLAVAAGAQPRLTEPALGSLATSRQATLQALATAGPVYGVTTGLGAQSHLAVGATEQPAFQDDLMLARSVGAAPWLDARQARAVVATRLRTLLEPEAGVSPDLARALVALLDAGLHPALPATGDGAAGEIIPLAHLGAFLTGRGEGLDASGAVRPAGDLLAGAGLAPYAFGAKEGIAFLQGVPVATALALLVAAEARRLAGQALLVAAAEIALVRAPRDPYDGALVRADPELAHVHARLRDLAGDEPAPRLLQAPVSFRVTGPGLAHLMRAVAALDAAVERALAGVSTSPALVAGRFLGTAGFDDFDLAAGLDALRLAVVHVAEVGAARLHRLLDPRVTGLPPQLSPAPGRQTGLVALHKQVVGLVHEARRRSAPAALGAMETSAGQEDVQSFGLAAARAAADAVALLRSTAAAELVAVHQATLLADGPPRGSAELFAVLHKAFAVLPSRADDRPTGRDVAGLSALLALGWGDDVLETRGDADTSSPPKP